MNEIVINGSARSRQPFDYIGMDRTTYRRGALINSGVTGIGNVVEFVVVNVPKVIDDAFSDIGAVTIGNSADVLKASSETDRTAVLIGHGRAINGIAAAVLSK